MLRTIISGITWCICRLPRQRALAAGALLGRTLYRCLPKRRRIAERNIKNTVGVEWPRGKVQHTARAAFENLGRTLVEFMAFPELDRAAIDHYVTVRGLEHFDRALEQGHGAILLTAHLGNWELLGATLAIRGYPLEGINKRQKGEFAAIINEYRESTGLRMFYKGISLRKAIRCLRNNHILGILTDQGGGQVVSLLGRETPFPQGAARLSLKLKSPILPTFIKREQETRHILEIQPPLEFKPTGDNAGDVVRLTQHCADVLSRQIRTAPEQYFWVHRIWKDLVLIRNRYRGR